jgi:serine/threonine-protein kinase
MTKPRFPSRYKPGDAVGRGRYVVIDLIAQGGMAEVYRVKDAAAEREFALKVLQFRHQQNERIRKKMEGEARALIELRHKSLVRVFEAGVDEGGSVVFFVMELLEGRSLQQLLRHAGKLPLADALEICAQVAEVLAYLNVKGIVHRDIKPDNIMVLPDGTVKVVDLGAARFERYGIVTTSPGDPIGTALYMSPEHLGGDPAHIDGRADIYSLGHVLYQCIAGHHGFFNSAGEGASMAEITGWQLRRDVIPLVEVIPSLPAPVWALVRGALHKERADRYPSNEEFANRIRATMLWLDAHGLLERSESPEPEVQGRTVIPVEEKALQKKKLPYAMTEEVRPEAAAAKTDQVPMWFEHNHLKGGAGTDVIPRLAPGNAPYRGAATEQAEPQLAKLVGPKGTFKMAAVDREPVAVQVTTQTSGDRETSPARRATSAHPTPQPLVAPVESDPRGAPLRPQRTGPDLRVAAGLGAVCGLLGLVLFLSRNGDAAHTPAASAAPTAITPATAAPTASDAPSSTTAAAAEASTEAPPPSVPTPSSTPQQPRPSVAGGPAPTATALRAPSSPAAAPSSSSPSNPSSTAPASENKPYFTPKEWETNDK